AQAAGLREHLGSLRQELRSADAGHALADALAREQAALDDLQTLRADTRERLAEAALLAELREQHDTLAAPPRLREANRLLAEFTRGRYALHLSASESGPVFTAEDLTAGQRLQLSELSDGTRTQLLLAVRVAFVTGAESGARPPLFLDEALTTSDPWRLAAVAASLGRLAAASGRQVFYLTSQPADVGAWRDALAAASLPAPTILDLAVARGQGTAAGPDQLAPVAAPAVAAPAGRSAAEYGTLLQVAVLDPLRPWQEADTFHLAAPDLELAHRLRVCGLASAGPLAAALPRLQHLGAADPGQQGRLARSLGVLQALLAAWRVGRPRPVEIADIDQSGAVSEVFRPRVLELLKETGWDAARILAAAAAGGIPNFRRNKLEALREHLADAGCLDERPPLGTDELVTEVLLRLAAAPQTQARTSLEEVRALVLRLLGAMPGAGASPPSG
ncbi:MAG: hypothetical protein IH621_12855, partial [Krumholzibacteria bacterium]|nr:hypothetical protein [Candidatus Krumholzibacteria bacterium]